MYKAKINIGGYKVGDEVPEEKAIVWQDMYLVSPVEKIGEESSNNDDDSSAVDSSVPEEASNAMHDDYLARNADVVCNAIKDDKLNISELVSLLKIETSNKKRKPVIKAIKLKMKSL